MNELTVTTAKPSNAVLYIQCELKPLPEKALLNLKNGKYGV
jgi:hypothetical protein